MTEKFTVKKGEIVSLGTEKMPNVMPERFYRSGCDHHGERVMFHIEVPQGVYDRGILEAFTDAVSALYGVDRVQVNFVCSDDLADDFRNESTRKNGHSVH